jgi:hypothetical protein
MILDLYIHFISIDVTCFKFFFFLKKIVWYKKSRKHVTLVSVKSSITLNQLSADKNRVYIISGLDLFVKVFDMIRICLKHITLISVIDCDKWVWKVGLLIN